MTPLTLTYRLSEAQFMHAAGVLWAYRAIGDKGNWITVILCLAAGPVLLLNGVATGWLFDMGAQGDLAARLSPHGQIHRPHHSGV